MNIYKISRVLIILALVFSSLGYKKAYSESDDGKKATDLYLEYLKSAQNADSFDDITSYWAGWMAESFDRGSEEQKKERLDRLVKSANEKKNATVVSTTKEGPYWVIKLKAVYPDGKNMKGQAKIIQENGKYVIEEEYWTMDM